MKIQEREFLPVLFASDINTYSMARAFHEAYGVRSVVIGKAASGPSCHSKIVNFIYDPDIDQDEHFLKTLNELAASHADKTIFAVGCGDAYAELLSKYRHQFADNVIAPYIDYELLRTLNHKESFYRLCDQMGLEYPATLIHKQPMGHDFDLPFEAPYILKPSDGVMYWAHPFAGQKKVYCLKTQEELLKTIDQIYASGYTDSLIIQDFIPGDDSCMHVMTCYSDHLGQVKLMSLGHVLLEEHTPHGLGNHAVILNEVNQELTLQLKQFLESIHFTGFSNFDIKYDERDGRYKLFEINLRQGRSNFYVTGAGDNLAKYLVEDYLEKKDLPLTIADRQHAWMVIPKRVAYKYIASETAVDALKETIRTYGKVNPLFYRGDYSPKRTYFLVRNYFSHFVKYRRYMS